jgi:hypothetical protein
MKETHDCWRDFAGARFNFRSEAGNLDRVECKTCGTVWILQPMSQGRATWIKEADKTSLDEKVNELRDHLAAANAHIEALKNGQGLEVVGQLDEIHRLLGLPWDHDIVGAVRSLVSDRYGKPPAAATRSTHYICEFCELEIFGSMIGMGDGSGNKFAHPDCYHLNDVSKAHRALDELVVPNTIGDVKLDLTGRITALVRQLAQPPPEMRECAGAFDDAVKIARGCLDYGGGYKDASEREKFHHGIATVINALDAARSKGLADPQIAALHSIGTAAAAS